MKRALAIALVVSGACGALGCVHAAAPGEIVVGKSERPSARPVQFSFDSLDDRPVNSAVLAGKPTVIVVMTSWDLSSQAQIDFLIPMNARDAGRVNYVMLALQEPKDRELVAAFVHGLGVTFPAALADADMFQGGGPFDPIRAVPTMVILDRAGRMVWRHVGLAKPEEIRDGLKGL